ncbi:MAG: mechanosensitive ion channel domain-containing protein [Pseudomonadales bacterium]
MAPPALLLNRFIHNISLHSAIFCLLICSAAQAQESAEKSSTSTEIIAPANDEPEPIPLSEIATETEATLSLLRSLERNLQEKSVLEAVQQQLPLLEAKFEKQSARTQSTLDKSNSLESLRELQAGWRTVATEVNVPKARLSKRVAKFGGQLKELTLLRKRWKSALDAARESEEPAEIQQNIDNNLMAIKKTRAAIKERRAAILLLQTELANLDSSVDTALERIEQRREELVQQLFVRGDPLWSPSDRNDSIETALTEFNSAVDESRQRITSFWFGQQSKLILHLICLLLLMWLLRVAKGRVRAAGKEYHRESLEVLDHPYSTAILLGLMPVSWIYPSLPTVMGPILGAIALLPTVTIARDYLSPTLRPLLYALAVFYLVDLFITLLALLPYFSRLLFVLKMAALAGFVSWLVWQPEQERQLAAATAEGVAEHSIIARCVIIVCLAAALFEAFGYSSLGRLIGQGVLYSAYAAMLLYAITRALYGLFVFALQRRPLSFLASARRHNDLFERRIGILLKWGCAAAWVWITLEVFELRQPVWNTVAAVFSARLEIGELSVSLGDIGVFALTIWAAFFIAGTISFILNEEVFPRIRLGRGVPYAITTLASYCVLLIGFFFAVAAAGVDFNRFTILAGAFGVGIGFGLQNIVNNFVSGLILLFERPIQVGDTLQMADVSGEVRRIGIRASTLRTWEGADVVVPNGELISQRVTNWTLADRNRRVDIKVGVAYGSDLKQIMQILLSSLEGHPDVMSYPEPQAFFIAFGDSSLDFELRFWTNRAERWLLVRSDISVAVNDALAAAGITIPFPQRDVHVQRLPVEPLV